MRETKKNFAGLRGKELVSKAALQGGYFPRAVDAVANLMYSHKDKLVSPPAGPPKIKELCLQTEFGMLMFITFQVPGQNGYTTDYQTLVRRRPASMGTDVIGFKKVENSERPIQTSDMVPDVGYNPDDYGDIDIDWGEDAGPNSSGNDDDEEDSEGSDEFLQRLNKRFVPCGEDDEEDYDYESSDFDVYEVLSEIDEEGSDHDKKSGTGLPSKDGPSMEQDSVMQDADDANINEKVEYLGEATERLDIK